MVSFKNKCITLRKQGFSLNQIVKKTKRSKTSVYFHVKKIPLSKKRWNEIKLARIKRFNDYSKRIKGKSRLNRHPVLFSSWDEKLVCLVAHLMFDGEIKYSGCVYTNRNEALLNQVTSYMSVIYGYQHNRSEPTPGVYRVSYFNVELSSYLRTKATELTKNILMMPRELQRSFLKTFFDDEGSVYHIKKRRAVRGFQHSYERLMLVKKLLKNFDIEGRVDKKYNEIVISRKENIEKFAREINFTAGVRVNGNRSNSVWKESLEKRNILKKALVSYQDSKAGKKSQPISQMDSV